MDKQIAKGQETAGRHKLTDSSKAKHLNSGVWGRCRAGEAQEPLTLAMSLRKTGGWAVEPQGCSGARVRGASALRSVFFFAAGECTATRVGHDASEQSHGVFGTHYKY